MTETHPTAGACCPKCTKYPNGNECFNALCPCHSPKTEVCENPRCYCGAPKTPPEGEGWEEWAAWHEKNPLDIATETAVQIPAESEGWVERFNVAFEDCRIVHVYDTEQYKVMMEFVREEIERGKREERERWIHQPANAHDAAIRKAERAIFENGFRFIGHLQHRCPSCGKKTQTRMTYLESYRINALWGQCFECTSKATTAPSTNPPITSDDV